MTKLRAWVGGGLAAIFLITAAGCIPLVVGAAVGAGGYAWVKGELEKDYEVTAEKLHRAAVRGLRDLKLVVKEDKGDRISASIKAEFSDGTDVSIHVAAKTERVANIKIRVGLLGDKERSEMIINAIEKRI